MLIAVNMEDGPSSSGFEDVYLVNNSVPDINMGEIDLHSNVLNKILQLPLIINAITGGTERAKSINAALARVARKHRIGLAVGSQTIGIENSTVRDSFLITREINPDGLILANVGAMTDAEKAIKAVEMIGADGLQIHFNIPQELAMAEGDRQFKGILSNVADIVNHCPVPVIAKEVGFGLSRESIAKLFHHRVIWFDLGGKGGTNFISIERQRKSQFGWEMEDWGIPTAVCLAEALSLKLPIKIIASGGIRSALDVARALGMGADCCGMAGPFLKILLDEGEKKLDLKINEFFYQIKSIFLMTGAKNIKELQTKPIVILNQTAEWLRVRGVDPALWAQR